MKISELIARLQTLQEIAGDVDVVRPLTEINDVEYFEPIMAEVQNVTNLSGRWVSYYQTNDTRIIVIR